MTKKENVEQKKINLPESITDGSRSTKTARGTCFPAPVDEKNVENESSLADTEFASMVPSGLIPCSKQYSSQQALPIWTPAWPT